MVDSQSQHDYEKIVSRRKFVALTGVAGAGAIAGCLGDDDNNGDGGSGDGGSGDGGSGDGGSGDGGSGDGELTEPEAFSQDYDDMDTYFHVGGWDDPSGIQFNPYNPSNYGHDLQNVVFDEFANYHFEMDEWLPQAATDWDFGEDEITINLRDDLVWSDGEAVTAEDVVTGMRLSEHQDGEIWDFADSVEASDDTTVTISLENSVNQGVAEWIVLIQRLNAPTQVYGEYLDRIDDGEDAEEVMGELASWANTEPVASGPFNFDPEEAGNEYSATMQNDEHPDADYINFNGYRRFQRGSNGAYHTSLTGGEFDGLLSLFVPESTIAQFPDDVDEIQIPATFGVGLVFNHDEEPVNDVNVRRAISFAIDAHTAAQNADPSTKSSPDVPVGIAASQIDAYLGDDKDMFEPYEQNTDQAAQILQDAGWERDGDDNWVDADGNPLELTFNYPSGWSDWVSIIESVASQLGNFGISVQLDGLSRANLVERVTNKDFQTAGFEWCQGAPQFNHPYFSLRHNLQNRQLLGDESFFNYPAEGDEVTVPAMDGDGEMTVNIPERLSDYAQAYDEDEAHEILLELAWVVNQDLPIIPLESKQEQSFLNSSAWDYPGDGDADVGDREYLQIMWPLYWLPKRGLLAATEE